MISSKLQTNLTHTDRLTFVNIGMQFSGSYLFHNISGTVAPGECLALLGPNGSGKSTLIRILAKLQRPSMGESDLLVNGRKTEDSAYRNAIGIVAPYLDYYDMLTGLENLLLFSRLRRTGCTRQQALTMLEKVDLLGAADNLVQTYSTGMKQRLKWAVLGVVDPAVWLLDEPFTFVDDHGRSRLLPIFREAQDRHRIIVLATNTAEEAQLAQAALKLG